MKNIENKEFRLPRKFTELWLNALRSGQYKQGIGALCTPEEKYCCLGVAGHLSGINKWNRKNDITRIAFLNTGTHFKRFEKNFKFPKKLPKELIGDADDNLLVSTLVAMNDTGKSFEEIADWIEENIELY